VSAACRARDEPAAASFDVVAALDLDRGLRELVPERGSIASTLVLRDAQSATHVRARRARRPIRARTDARACPSSSMRSW